MDVGNMSQPKHSGTDPQLRQAEPTGFDLRRLARRLRLRLYHVFFLVRRPMTRGVRMLAFDRDGRIFLVRHTYVSGWHLPGGGVEPGETVLQAVEKELFEEGNLTLVEAPRLAGIYLNRGASRRDHVVLYHCALVAQERAKQADREIAEAGFFDVDALPEGTTPATRKRLAELNGSEASPYW